jgi:hypothetical protein
MPGPRLHLPIFHLIEAGLKIGKPDFQVRKLSKKSFERSRLRVYHPLIATAGAFAIAKFIVHANTNAAARQDVARA